MAAVTQALLYHKKRVPITRARRLARRAYFIVIPIIAYILLWNFVPLVYGLFLGFTEYNALGKAPEWVGFKNFKTFFEVPDFLVLLRRQIWLGLVSLAFNTIVSFLFALVLNVRYKAKSFYRAVIYMPNIAAITATTAVFVALLNPLSTQGLNKLLVSLGSQPVTWSYSAFWMFFWIVVFFVWKNCGPATIIFLGGLQSIDPSLYEAAKVDGAGFWQQVRYITIPGLSFVTMFIILTGIINAMQMFDVVMFISKGGPFSQTDVLAYRIYRDGILNFNLGMAGAESLILGLVTIGFSLGYLYFQNRRKDVE